MNDCRDVATIALRAFTAALEADYEVDTKGVGDAQERVDRHVLLALLDVRVVHRVHSQPLCDCDARDAKHASCLSEVFANPVEPIGGARAQFLVCHALT